MALHGQVPRRGLRQELGSSEREMHLEYEKIFTFVRADNPAALQTYLAQGFQTVGTAVRHALIGGKYVDEIIIEKHLVEASDRAV
jgi:RimJ/RimL family protein N-acetyltransferase